MYASCHSCQNRKHGQHLKKKLVAFSSSHLRTFVEGVNKWINNILTRLLSRRLKVLRYGRVGIPINWAVERGFFSLIIQFAANRLKEKGGKLRCILWPKDRDSYLHCEINRLCKTRRQNQIFSLTFL